MVEVKLEKTSVLLKLKLIMKLPSIIFQP